MSFYDFIKSVLGGKVIQVKGRKAWLDLHTERMNYDSLKDLKDYWDKSEFRVRPTKLVTLQQEIEEINKI